MTTGAACDLVQSVGRPGSLNAALHEAKLFYAIVALTTVVAMAPRVLGFNPMRALVWSGMVQGFSVPPLLFMMLPMTNDRAVMGGRVNGRVTNWLGWTTDAITLIAAGGLVVTWFP